MINFFDTEYKINHSQINEIEQLVNLNFPTEYKLHLLKHNGGTCKPNVFTFYEDGKIADSMVDWFLAIYDGEYDNLKTYIIDYKLEKKRMPNSVFPIAHDPGGNLICIDTLDGKVYFWNHEKEVDYSSSIDKSYNNLFLIAESFSKFLDSLKASL